MASSLSHLQNGESRVTTSDVARKGAVTFRPTIGGNWTLLSSSEESDQSIHEGCLSDSTNAEQSAPLLRVCIHTHQLHEDNDQRNMYAEGRANLVAHQQVCNHVNEELHVVLLVASVPPCGNDPHHPVGHCAFAQHHLKSERQHHGLCTNSSLGQDRRRCPTEQSYQRQRRPATVDCRTTRMAPCRSEIGKIGISS